MLFGGREAENMERKWQTQDLSSRQINATPQAFWENDWPQIKQSCQIRDHRFLNDCLEAVLIAIANYYGSDSGADYERLCKGPTFQELESILGELWQMTEECHRLLPARLGQLLDEQIDNGFIVPMTDLDGRRVFRKGEPHPWGRSAREILRFVYGDVNPADNIQAVIKDLPMDDSEQFTRMLLRLETQLA